MHFGGMSDPFQPCEAEYKRTLKALDVFAKTQYPVIISTKGRLCVERPWIDYLARMNVVMQISAVCEKYDELEPGAPPFEERLDMVKRLSPVVKRVIIRAQPYVHDVLEDCLINIPRFKEAGAYGIIFEGMKFVRKKPGLIKLGGDYVQKKEVLQQDFERLKQACHKSGLKFYSGENRLRAMGDSLTCCGIDDLDGFRPNTYNLSHAVNGDFTNPTEAQRKPGTAMCFGSLFQNTAGHKLCKKHSFESMMKWYFENRNELVNNVLRGEKL